MKKHPQSVADLIGPAATVGKVCAKTVQRLKSGEDTEIPGFLLYGPPGVAKTALAVILASMFSGDTVDVIHDGSPLATEMLSGLDVNVELVRRWLGTRGMGNLFGDWQVRLVEELDRVPRDAQDLMLHYLDKLPPKTAFIGTSNMQLDLLQERFQTRLRAWKIMPPSTEELIGLLEKRGLNNMLAKQTAVASGGNVRAALLDARNLLDVAAAA